ncbi:GerAB/ArcD/ProY family transporter [Halobacillus naozhouensis]|uniref:GerAB/ArcD/ProY family transporter n=1 Tax=Halobacillus naozhouensis TaxID=554880 RepID=A0ABY8J5K9_9BACI|nr:GerAB/ArcD/ProY family transporter [Halobacillus naozhouensis]WFT76849.1 GerAB/ArcD/ProY family transporter [Halobacillus naozhouensis]
MEKVKISGGQLFILMFLFELGTAIVIGPGLGAEKDAWLAVLLGLISGMILFLVYYALYRLYPDQPLTGYAKKILGKYIGSVIGIVYLFYFIYIASRDLRDFGELLTASTYTYTPMFVINAFMILAVAYVLFLGIEVLARTGEIFFFLLMLIGVVGTILVLVSGMIEVHNLLPILENGWGPVLQAWPTTYTFPFGEMVAFTVLLPYLNRPNLGLRVGLSAMSFSGILLMWVVAMEVAVLSVYVATRSTFPLLSAIGLVNMTGFFQRLDVVVVLTLIIGGFFKIAVFFYAALISATEVFRVSKYTRLIFPFSIVILLSSMTVANNYAGHIQEGLEISTYYASLPFQTGIPLLLLVIALIRRYFKNR